MIEDEDLSIKTLLRERGCLYECPPPGTGELKYHFVGINGKHLGGYCDIDPVLPDVPALWGLTGEFASIFGDHGLHPVRPEVVVTPTTGAIPLGHLTAIQLIHELSGVSHVDAVWAKKVGKPRARQKFVFKHGFASRVKGKSVLVVDGIINQGYPVDLLADAVRKAGGAVVAVAAIAYNTRITASLLGVPVFVGLCAFGYPVKSESECRQNGWCADGVPIVVDEALGHGAGYRDAHPELPSDRFVTLRS